MIVNDPPSVTVVSAREVDRDAADTVPVAFACTRVPLGFHALSVSIRIPRATLGDTYFLSDNLTVLPATPDPNQGISKRVLPVTSPIACTVVEAAKVAQGSTKRASQAVISSPG